MGGDRRDPKPIDDPPQALREGLRHVRSEFFRSLLVAWAHGAGFMVVPIVLGMSAAMPAGDLAATRHHLQMGMAGGSWTAFTATLVHTTGYLLVTGLVAWVVYARLGLSLLRKAWLNLDLFWALALILTGGLALLT